MDKVVNFHLYEFVWDKIKDESNIMKHGVSFARATHIFLDPLALSQLDKSHSLFEERWLTLGIIDDGRLIVASHTYNELSDSRMLIRLISARFATRRERLYYETQPQNGDRYVH
jgi:uncharacterized DUF497 family protein